VRERRHSEDAMLEMSAVARGLLRVYSSSSSVASSTDCLHRAVARVSQSPAVSP
jgi:hypothetical protein